MSFICKIDPYKLDPGVTVVSVDYEVATDPLMENIIRYSYNDTVNLKSIVFDYELENGKTYYGRTRALLSTGPLKYGPINSFKYDAGEDSDFMLTTPSPINTPKLTTLFWKTEHPTSCFTIYASGFEVIGNSKLSRCSWSISEVLTGKSILLINKRSFMNKLFVDIILKPETQYRLEMTYFADNDSASKTSTMIFTTGKNLTNHLSNVLSSRFDSVVIKTSDQMPNSRHEWYILDSESKILNPIDTRESSVASFLIDKTLLNDGSVYLLQTREINDLNPDAKYEYFPFKTEASLTYGLPGPFPYRLGFGLNPTDSEELINNSQE